jgi:hypothetical protein
MVAGTMKVRMSGLFIYCMVTVVPVACVIFVKKADAP